MELFLALWSLLSSGTSLATLAFFFIVLALLLDFTKRRRSWSRYPPGPPSLPFFGNILQADVKHFPEYCNKLRKKYGDVFSFQFCWDNVVIINGLESVKEGLITKSEDTSDRPYFPITDCYVYKENCAGMVLAKYGQSWKEVRRFSLSTLRDFGLGKKSLEERVMEEAEFLCSALKSKSGSPFDPYLMLNNAVSNVICSIIFGDRFEYDDKKFLTVMRLFEDIIKTTGELLPQLVNVVPALVHIPGVKQKIFRAHNKLFDFLRGVIAEHKEGWDPNVKRDFIDAFLEKVEQVKGDPSSSFNEPNLFLTVVDLFTAGSGTTSTTLRFGLLYMILYPNLQSKVQEEIDQVIGRERQPTMDDRANMPYTSAVLNEIQRCGDILPLSVPHMTSRDTEIHGFFIPKGTTLMFNLTSILKDESIWENPYQFYPEHFLDADGQLIKRDAFMPFSAGRRVCLGEQMAKMNLFLFFTSIFQKFTFHIPRDQPRPSEMATGGTIRAPLPYQLCVEVR
ncbi:cytochrome P450 2D15-like [Pleurodeles waltl]|uniref:cytochrome P450 2D15-like n=1 Tax=Pleurodeles waltl TaxID=8319 RepID=UPI003709A486